MLMVQRFDTSDRPLRPGPSGNRDPLAGEVERRTLPPVGNQALGSIGLGYEDNLWNGLSAKELEQLLFKLSLPSRSPVLQKLLVRAMLSDVALPEGAGERPGHFLALRLETLRRAGRLQDIIRLTEGDGQRNRQPTAQTYHAYAQLGLGNRQQACREANAIPVGTPSLPRQTLGLSLLLVAYCAAAEGHIEAAQLNLSLARDQGLNVSLAESALEKMARAGKPRIGQSEKIQLPDYLFLRLAKWQPSRPILKHAGPNSLVAMSHDDGIEETLRLDALEQAARANAADHVSLANAYKRQHFDPTRFNQPLDNRFKGARRRAFLYQALTVENEPHRRIRLIKSFLETARRDRLYLILAKMIAKPIMALPLSERLLGFAAIMIEANAAAGNYRRASEWAVLTSATGSVQNDALLHWLSLFEIAQYRGRARADGDLQLATRNALAGRFGADILHRLVTVLDALQYNIPIPLWDAASRTAQPSQGYLPETGALSRLKLVANRGNVGKTLLLAMAALGPDGPDGAHMIALGDTIRALKIVGHEAEARQIGFEALFAIWPRQASQ